METICLNDSSLLRMQCQLLQYVNIPFGADVPVLFRPYGDAELSKVRHSKKEHESYQAKQEVKFTLFCKYGKFLRSA